MASRTSSRSRSASTASRIAQSKAGTPIKLTLPQVFLALAKEVPGPDGKLIANPNKNWSDIDKSLPEHQDRSARPAPDLRHARLRSMSCCWRRVRAKSRRLPQLKKSDPKAFDKVWKSMREDGAYVEAGENDNVIVQKLEANKNAFGVFGYSFLEENTAKLRGVRDRTASSPTYDNIASGKYPGSRPLFIYIKKQHVGVIPGLDKFVAEYVSAEGDRRRRLSRQEGPGSAAEEGA